MTTRDRGTSRRGRRHVAALVVPLLSLVAAACGAGAAGSGSSTSDPGTSVTTSSGPPSSSSSTSTSTTSTLPATQPLPQPTAAHPLTIVEIGDSLGEDLGFGLGDVFGSKPLVKVVQAARGDTGLARPDYYDWPAHVKTLLQAYHPGVLVVFLGANDGQGFTSNGQVVQFGSSLWHSVYSARVAAVMSEATAAGTRVLWVGLPLMQDPGFEAEMAKMNAIFSAEAVVHPGVVYFSSIPVLANAAGQYAESIPGPSGSIVLRQPDGVHMATGGDDRLAQALIAPIEHNWGVDLTSPGG